MKHIAEALMYALCTIAIVWGIKSCYHDDALQNIEREKTKQIIILKYGTDSLKVIK